MCTPLNPDLTSQEHKQQSEICKQKNRQLDSIYHHLMSLETNLHYFNPDDNLFIYSICKYNTDDPEYEDYIAMTTMVLDANPEYGNFWRFLAHIYDSMLVHTAGDDDARMTKVFECYHKGILLGNIGCMQDWVHTFTYRVRMEYTEHWENHKELVPIIIDTLHTTAYSTDEALADTSRYAADILETVYRYGCYGIPKDLEKAEMYYQLLFST